MALHQIVEKHKVTILGQEIIHTNKFIKYTEGTSYSFKPQSSLISYASGLFKYEFEHPYLTPSLFIDSKGNKYIVPSWIKVHPKTTLKDIEVIRPTKEKVAPIEKETWKFESSSEPGIFYKVRKQGDKLICNCSGYFRCKNRDIGCKHCQEVRKQLK
jgi:retron-type reverse transcriptase